MKNFLLILALAVSVTAISQNDNFFQEKESVKLFFKADLNVDYIVVMPEDLSNVYNGVRNVDYENAITFLSPGDFVAVGVSYNEDGSYNPLTCLKPFTVSDETVSLSTITLVSGQ